MQKSSTFKYSQISSLNQKVTEKSVQQHTLCSKPGVMILILHLVSQMRILYLRWSTLGQKDIPGLWLWPRMVRGLTSTTFSGKPLAPRTSTQAEVEYIAMHTAGNREFGVLSYMTGFFINSWSALKLRFSLICYEKALEWLYMQCLFEFQKRLHSQLHFS